jgi:hypothetical protein
LCSWRNEERTLIAYPRGSADFRKEESRQSRFALENFHPLRFQWQTKKDSSWHIKGSTNTDWQQLTWLCYARTGKGKNLRVQRRKRSFLPFVSLRYNTSAPHGGRNGNSDGRATEVRKPEEKGRVFDAADSTCSSPSM